MLSFSTPSIAFALLLQLPPFRTSDPALHSRHSSALVTTVHAFHFITIYIIQLFLPSSTRVELCVAALGAVCRQLFGQEQGSPSGGGLQLGKSALAVLMCSHWTIGGACTVWIVTLQYIKAIHQSSTTAALLPIPNYTRISLLVSLRGNTCLLYTSPSPRD